MKFDDQFANRVSLARQSRGMTQAQLSKLTGVVQRQIAAYEGGESKPRERVLRALASALGTTADWLICGDGEGPGMKNIIPDALVRQIPVLRSNEVMNYITTGEHSSSEFHPSVYDTGDSAFAMLVQGDAMTRHAGNGQSGLSFPEGSVITFNPLVKAKSGDYVLVLFGDDSVAFKQIYIGEIETNLVSLNQLYPNIILRNEEVSILATAVYLEVPLSSY